MKSKSDLEEYITFGMTGGVEFKKEEKQYFLGEFKENVIFSLSFDAIKDKNQLNILKDKCEQRDVKKIIVASHVSNKISDQIMNWAKLYEKEYKMVFMKDESPIAVVLATHPK